MNSRRSLLAVMLSGSVMCVLAGAWSSMQQGTTGDEYPGNLRVHLESSQVASWRTDPAWHGGKAEWALYEATRPIYGQRRSYEATIFTNKQHMDLATTTKASDWRAPNTIEVFKHNLSEIIPTENYDYRFLTTSFVRVNNLEPYKIVASTQEDCGATYKQFTFAGGDGGEVDALSLCYFPGGGEKRDTYDMRGQSRHFRFHDDLSLTLRDFPFDDPESSDRMMKLIPDQTDTHETNTRFEEAQIHYEGRETINVPYGAVDAHHLRIAHRPDGGVTESHYWFAADAGNMRHVMVKYEGPYGVSYELKKLRWWAYWDRSALDPRESNEPRP